MSTTSTTTTPTLGTEDHERLTRMVLADVAGRRLDELVSTDDYLRLEWLVEGLSDEMASMRSRYPAARPELDSLTDLVEDLIDRIRPS